MKNAACLLMAPFILHPAFLLPEIPSEAQPEVAKKQEYRKGIEETTSTQIINVTSCKMEEAAGGMVIRGRIFRTADPVVLEKERRAAEQDFKAALADLRTQSAKWGLTRSERDSIARQIRYVKLKLESQEREVPHDVDWIWLTVVPDSGQARYRQWSAPCPITGEVFDAIKDGIEFREYHLTIPKSNFPGRVTAIINPIDAVNDKGQAIHYGSLTIDVVVE